MLLRRIFRFLATGSSTLSPWSDVPGCLRRSASSADCRKNVSRPLPTCSCIHLRKRLINQGLDRADILNFGSPSVKRPPGEPPASPLHPLALLMFIFPRQFGLKNVFTTPLPSFSSSNVNYGDQGRRAEEIAGRKAAGTLKIDKKSRMRNPVLQALMKELRSNWQKEDVWKLRSMHCPSKVRLSHLETCPPVCADVQLFTDSSNCRVQLDQT